MLLRTVSPVGGSLKRLIDATAAITGLLLLSPVFVGVAVLIRLDSRGPVFFRQIRVGRNERPFKIWKFRTMTAAPDAHGPGITTKGDVRVTRIGRVLRRWKLDELPQLINVARGEMSLVGPRPELPAFVALYQGRQREVLRVRPGITDPASLEFRDEEEVLARAADPIAYYRAVVMPRKLELNLEYCDRATVGSDIAIVLRTIAAVLR